MRAIYEYELRTPSDLFGEGGPCRDEGGFRRAIKVLREGGGHCFSETDYRELPHLVAGLDWETFASTMRVHVDIAKALYVRYER